MDSFGDLLNEYIQRSGISDTELARTVGVSRQTVFRWREGVTARPRHREDVLRLARKLRLTLAERDRLLLAADFRPEAAGLETDEREVGFEESIAQDEQAEEPGSGNTGEPGRDAVSEIGPGTTPPVGETAREAAERRRMATERRRTGPGLVAGLGLGALVIVGILLFGGWALLTRPPLDPANDKPAPLALSAGVEAPAAEPDTLLITHFANYASSQVGYNVAGRLAEALQREIREIDEGRLENTQIDLWPEAVAERDEALRVGMQAGATLVIYGQYDVGRVLVKFAHPADQDIFTDPALSQHTLTLEDLSTAINNDLPQQVRSLALIALGQIYLNQAQPDVALPLLTQARNNLQGDPDIEAQTWAVANFFLGIAHYHSAPPHLDEAIAAYGQAIDAWPEMVASRLNRIAAYEARHRPGDLELALADAEALVEAAPAWALSYNNRASIRLSLGGPQNLALAIEDLDQTLALDPDLAPAYLNRAIAHFRQGQPVTEILPDVEKAIALRPDYGSAFNLLCWGYGLEGAPEAARPHCEQAVQLNPDDALFRDSRGLSYALLGEFEKAIADFESYADWLERVQPGTAWQRELMRRRAWIEALEAGENPFTPEILAILRAEIGQ